MPCDVSIRRATHHDAQAISDLIMYFADQFVTPGEIFSQETPYYHEITPDAIETLIASENREYFVCEIDGVTQGVGSICDAHHIGHLFVAEQYQRRGIASMLWEVLLAEAKANGTSTTMTVNSSVCAIRFYEHLGFHKTGDRIDKNGVSFVPMEYEGD